MALIGVRALAKAIGKAQGTISKHAAAGKIPVAARDPKGNPMFDVDQVRAAYENNINPLMRRAGSEVAAPSLVDEDDELAGGDDDAGEGERRSTGASRPSSSLLRQQTLERQLRNRRLLRQIAEDEGLVVLKSVVDADQMTTARRVRDGVTGLLADKASALYAFVGERPRTEAELRVWLDEHCGQAFDEVARLIAAEDEDEFADAEPLEPGEPVAATAS